MSYYEGMFLVSTKDLASEGEALKSVQEIITKRNGVVRDIRKWDERRLAYDVGPHHRGLYLLAHFEALGDAVPEIRRDCQLSERVIRVLILARKKKEFDTALEHIQDIVARTSRIERPGSQFYGGTSRPSTYRGGQGHSESDSQEGG